ncbi:MAG: DUF4238 domain-containing protein [Chloroflexota bacterium]
MPKERRQHFLPEFHLGLFATGRRREVWVFDKLHGKYGRRPVASSAFSRDYYALPGATEDERLALEREFARLENLVAPLIRRLDSVPPGPTALDEGERINLAGYAALLHVRVPAYRDDALKRAQELSVDPEALGLADPVRFLGGARRRGIHGSDEDLERRRLQMLEGLQTGAFRVTFTNAISLGGIAPALSRGAPLMLAREWELLRVGAFPGLVIGDQPVTLFSHGQLAPSIGFGSPDVQVMVPLSDRTLLLVSDRPRPPMPLFTKVEVRPGLREPWWSIANKVAWLTAQRYVWGRSRAALEATESTIRPDLRQRDLRVLDEEQEARRREIARERLRVTPP